MLYNQGVITPWYNHYLFSESLMMSQDGYIQISELVTCLSDILLPGKSCLPPSLVSRLDIVIRGIVIAEWLL